MVGIRYVGSKPAAADNVARSGKIWNGNGDVQEVSERQARLLLRHPDQWALENPDDLDKVQKEPVTRFINPDGERVEVSESDLKKPIDKMSADELRAYALERHQKTFPPRASRKLLLDEVEDLERGLEPMKRN